MEDSVSTIAIDLGAQSYEISIGHPDYSDLGSACLSSGLAGSALIVTDSHVAAHYAEACENSLVAAGIDACIFAVPAGENSKSHDQLKRIYDTAFEIGLDRKSFIVALGGGVVGDLAGYAAATFLRGIPYVQVPTSLLAMVDSSVGGKTGINVSQGKNLIGAFHQPKLVYVSLASLVTLPEREYAAGLAEVIKYGIIEDKDLFDLLATQQDAVKAKDAGVLQEIVKRSCEIKAAVVEKDEKEAGLRAVLNFGHSLGHAIENVAGYGKYLHGEAISVGMCYAARVSEKVLDLDNADVDAIESLFADYNLPIRASEFDWATLSQPLKQDKKMRRGQLQWVLADALGSVSIGHEVDEAVLEETWEEMRD